VVPLGARQDLVLWLFATMATAVLAVFVFVVLTARRRLEYEAVRPHGYFLRSWWFAVLLGLCAFGFAVSLASLPYPAEANPTGAPALQVRVNGVQWAWILSTDRVPAGRLIEFDVTAGDVNHGFGIYSPQGVLLGQVQAMPGYVNRLFFRFPHPGVYLVRCMEYCGAEHPYMVIPLTVYRAS
jgi:cytochrome c oxidase subunit 2